MSEFRENTKMIETAQEPLTMTTEIAQEDRRDALRQESRVITLIAEHAERGRFMCQVMDVSRRGMRLRIPVNLPNGSEILVNPPMHESLKPSPAKIIRQQVVEEGDAIWYECGIRYTDAAELRRHTWFLTLRNAA
jgi:hypothetical protein